MAGDFVSVSALVRHFISILKTRNGAKWSSPCKGSNFLFEKKLLLLFAFAQHHTCCENMML